LLQEDLADDRLRGDPNAYLHRAHQIALGVAEAGNGELADRICQRPLEAVDVREKETGLRLYKGALMANR
jgi:hypothetical protein